MTAQRGRTLRRKEPRRVSKAERQLALRKVLEEGAPRNQQQLVARLEIDGIVTTQATVSRDLDELGASRIRTSTGRPAYTLDSPVRGRGRSRGLLARRMAEAAVSIEASGDMVVVKTMPGHAPSVAATIDDADIDQVVGTIAGDDTILVIARPKAGAALAKLLRSPDDTGGDNGK